MYDVKVPPIKALIPILAKFFLWLGAISPIPEICIATDEKFAKPDNANVVIIKLFSEMISFTASKSVNANASFNTNFVPEVVDIMQELFEIGLRIAAPIIATIFVADVVLGILSRTIPQMNVFQLGMPLKVMIGLAVIMVTFLYANGVTQSITDLMNEYMIRFLTRMNS